MTEIARDVLDNYQVRKSRAQRERFRDYATHFAVSRGYSTTVDRAPFGARNLVVGDPNTARVVFTAHYDTCALLPFPNFITPKHFMLYLIYQIALSLAILAPATVTYILLLFLLPSQPYIASCVAYLLLLICGASVIFGPASKNTVNDNSSGVIALLEMIDAMPEEKRGEVAFIFFDLEEMGLIGSSSYAKRHSSLFSKKLLINLDCISDGDVLLLAVKKKATDYLGALETAFASDERMTVDIATRGVFYPSDQMAFPLGVGVAAMKRTRGGIYYMDRIHTRRDTVYREENIAFAVESALRLVSALSENSADSSSYYGKYLR